MGNRVRSRTMGELSGVVSGTRVRANVAAGDFTPVLVTVPDIEILEVGEYWETSTGVFSWDEEELASAISSQDDPAVRGPVLKLGHIDEREGFDGQPSFGRLINLRLKNNDQTLCCDLAGVPKWLADVMPTAYPRRSIEGWFGAETRTGNTWPFVLTGMALLGAAYPAIHTLDDLPILWGEEMPPMEPADEEDEDQDIVEAETPAGLIRARKVIAMPTWLAKREQDEGKVSAAAGKRGNGGQVKASTSVSDVTSAYYAQLGPGQSWWWIRQVLVNPFQLVVDDDEGGLMLVDVSVDANDNITFGEGQPVKVEYVAAVAANLVEVRKSGQVVAASHGDRVAAGAPEKPTDDADADEDDDDTDDGADDPTEEEQDNVLTDEALRALGLEPGATAEQINAAVMQRAQGGGDGDKSGGGSPDPGSEPSGTPGGGDGGTGGDGDGAGDGDGDGKVTTEPGGTTTPATAPTLTLPEGTVLVDSAQWQEVQQEVAASKQTREQQRVAARDSYLKEACRTGKFPRARIAHYTTMWEADPAGTKTLIDSMAPGLVPVIERGSDAETDPQVAASGTAYPDSWKRDARVVSARNSVSTRVKVVND